MPDNFTELAQQQSSTGSEIQRIITNYKKDRHDRKTTKTYYEEKLHKLEREWTLFETTDEKIRQLPDPALDHPYFSKDYYHVIAELYQQYKKEFLQRIAELDDKHAWTKNPTNPTTTTKSLPTATPSEGAVPKTPKLQPTAGLEPQATTRVDTNKNEGSNTKQSSMNGDIARLMRRQTASIDSLKRLFTRIINDLREEQPHQYFQTMKDAINQLWCQIREYHQDIWELALDPAAEGYDLQEYIQLEDDVHQRLINLTTQQNLQSQQRNAQENPMYSAPPQQQPSAMINLPKITLPRFDGEYIKWPQFSNLYTELVHKQPISNAQKMFYLKANVAGEASKLIQHLPASNEHYEKAWELLHTRYNNTRLIASALLYNLFQQPACSSESAISLKRIHDTTKESLSGISNLGINTTSWDPMVTYLILQKLDSQTRRLFEESLDDPRKLPALSTLLEYLETHFQMLESIGTKRDKPIPSKPTNGRQLSLLTTSPTATISGCILCKRNDHRLHTCASFQNLPIRERLQQVKKLNLCFNCLGHNHTLQQCRSRSCLKCNRRHHTLLHLDSTRTEASANLSTTKSESKVASTGFPTTLYSQSAQAAISKYIFLGTAIIYVKTKYGNEIECRAVLDSGSQVNIISDRLHKLLGITTGEIPTNIIGIGQSRLKVQKQLTVSIKSKTTGFSTAIDVVVLPQITSLQPSALFNISDWPLPKNVKLADPDFNKPRQIDLLIGAELYCDLLSIGQIKLAQDLPTLQNTVFGWIVQGRLRHDPSSESTIQTRTCGISTVELHDQLQRFWAMEEDGNNSKSLTSAEQRCEESFRKTVRRSNDGRFIVRLPFRSEPSILGDSQKRALTRFFQLEGRLQKNKELQQQYQAFMHEYIQLGHMELINPEEIPNSHYFLPHHCVIKLESTTTKLRVVFDGSAKTTSNISLNDILLPGPVIQDGLLAVLLRFRLPAFVFTADIAKMYRQIWVASEDRNYQLIFWRDTPTEPLRTYRLCTVTYGTSSAPYLATKCLQRLADEVKGNYPLAANIIRRDFYVDDLMTGADSLETALEYQSQVQAALNTSKFPLRKWCANHPRLLRDIPEADIEVKFDLSAENHKGVKTLGLTWIPEIDTFIIKIHLPSCKRITKRTILSDVAHIYDPLGLVNPVVVTAKLFIQELWLLKIDWDASLPQSSHTRWIQFREELRELNELSIPRRVTINKSNNTQLHAFADASERAYGTCLYLRTTDHSGNISVSLIYARSRVAPCKRTTIPRLELAAAKLAAEATQNIKNYLHIPINDVILWTDSTIVLSWISSSSSSFQPFVANRITAIHNLSEPEQWRHIPTEINPADIISRGTTSKKLKTSDIWFHGPAFLKLPEHQWPIPPRIFLKDESEKKQSKHALIATNERSSILTTIEHKNSFIYLQRVIAYILRFASNARVPRQERTSKRELTAEEIFNALITIIREMQQENFCDELRDLRRYGTVKSSSRLITLRPFLDQHKIIRVGGRLEAADLDWEARHQIIISNKHWVTKLLVQYIHKKHLHAGPQALLSLIRQRFWPLQGKQLVKTVVHQCIRCSKAKPRMLSQIMGNLPSERIIPSRPFTNVGIDFCGPLYIHYKIRGKQPTKAYVAIFVCFSTKACHIELVSDLTTAAFLGCLKRFIARRGRPTKIFSDNATNFIGARNELKELHEFVWSDTTQNDATRFCAEEQIQWITIPPRSPHFGGLWEAAVKAAKFHMKRVVSGASLTYEEMYTVLTEIEAILNSRPITTMTNNAEDAQALTPGHFLIGAPLTTLPNPYQPSEKLNTLTRWKLVNGLQREFWKRWKMEYLQQLQLRYKWSSEHPNIQPGTIVLLHEDNTPPLKWPLGKVIATHKGDDGRVRVVEVKTASGVVKRAIQRVSPLPISSNGEEIEGELCPQPDQVTNIITDAQELKRGTKKGPRKRKIAPINPAWGKGTNEIPHSKALQRYLSHKLETEDKERKPEDKALKPVPTTKKHRIHRFNTTTVLLTTLMCLIIPRSCTEISNFVGIQPFSTHPGLYFEGLGQADIITDEWNLIIYYKMSGYWNELALLKDSITRIRHICRPLSSYTEYCASTVALLDHHISVVTATNQLLHGIDKAGRRTRRSPLNIIGNIANKLFGILDEEYAEQMVETISQLKANDRHLQQLAKNQTSLIDSTLNLIRRDNEYVNKQFALVEEHISEIKQELREANYSLAEERILNRFNSLTILTTLILNDYQRIQEGLINVITDAGHGRINPLILTPEQLQAELHKIRENIPSSLSMPGQAEGSSLRLLYGTMTVKARILKAYIMFNVKIPLVSREKFEVFKITPIPIHQNGMLNQIKASSDYIVINLHRDHYYQMNKEDLATCFITDQTHYLCHPRYTVNARNAGGSQCELELFNNLNSQLPKHCIIEGLSADRPWSKLEAPNTWLYALEVSQIFSIVCGNHIFKKQLQGVGLIHFKSNCIMKHNEVMISSSHQPSHLNAQSTFLPALKFNINTIEQHISNQSELHKILHPIIIKNNSKEIEQLRAQLTAIQANSELPQIPIHHSIINYTGLTMTSILTITIIGSFIIRWILLQKQRKQPANIPAQQMDFELHSLNIET